MKRAIDVGLFGELADPRVVARLAARAEEQGWDGFFVWDHIAYRPPVCPCRQYRYSAPGVETTLYSRLVGVTDGLGVPRTLTWNGSSSTAPEIPAGVASTAMT